MACVLTRSYGSAREAQRWSSLPGQLSSVAGAAGRCIADRPSWSRSRPENALIEPNGYGSKQLLGAQCEVWVARRWVFALDRVLWGSRQNRELFLEGA